MDFVGKIEEENYCLLLLLWLLLVISSSQPTRDKGALWTPVLRQPLEQPQLQNQVGTLPWRCGNAFNLVPVTITCHHSFRGNFPFPLHIAGLLSMEFPLSYAYRGLLSCTTLLQKRSKSYATSLVASQKLSQAKLLRWPSCSSCVGCEMATIWGFPGFAAVASRITSQKCSSVNLTLLYDGQMNDDIHGGCLYFVTKNSLCALDSEENLNDLIILFFSSV